MPIPAKVRNVVPVLNYNYISNQTVTFIFSQPQYFQTYPYYNPQQPVAVIQPLVQMPVPQFHEPYRSPSGMNWTDEKRDLTYCRILAAEEFLAVRLYLNQFA